MPTLPLRVITLMLMCVIVSSACVYGPLQSLVLKFHQTEQRLTIARRNSTNLIELRIPKSAVEKERGSFVWLEDDEFSWQDKSYDVISSRLIGDTWFFTALRDSHEDKIRNEIARNTESGSSSNVSLKKNIKFNGDFFESFEFVLTDKSVTVHLYSIYPTRMNSVRAEVQDPPPWLS